MQCAGPRPGGPSKLCSWRAWWGGSGTGVGGASVKGKCQGAQDVGTFHEGASQGHLSPHPEVPFPQLSAPAPPLRGRPASTVQSTSVPHMKGRLKATPLRKRAVQSPAHPQDPAARPGVVRRWGPACPSAEPATQRVDAVGTPGPQSGRAVGTERPAEGRAERTAAVCTRPRGVGASSSPALCRSPDL